MSSQKTTTVLARGAVWGALILGVVGRAAMAVIALVSGQSVNLSLRGTVQVIVLGALAGVVAAPVLMLLRNLLPARRPLRVLLLALVLFAVTWFAPRPPVSTAGSATSPLAPTLVAIALVLIAFGLTLDTQLSRGDGNR